MLTDKSPLQFVDALKHYYSLLTNTFIKLCNLCIKSSLSSLFNDYGNLSINLIPIIILLLNNIFIYHNIMLNFMSRFIYVS